MNLVHALSETWTLTTRMFRHNLRSPDTIMTVLVSPMMIMLLFVFVLGGAMNTGQTRYIDYVLPVVLLLCIASGIAYTTLRVNQDVSTGMFARFHTMPIARPALIGGHIVASVVVNAVSMAVVWLVALLCGYRSHAGFEGWLVSLGLLALALVAFSVMGVAFGMTAKSAEGGGMYAYLLMGLMFVSSGFAPTETMSSGLRAFADHQPMTPIINAVRDAQQLGHPSGSDGWVAVAWLLAITVVFAFVARVGGRGVGTRL